jgi:hypothetical protein
LSGFRQRSCAAKHWFPLRLPRRGPPPRMGAMQIYYFNSIQFLLMRADGMEAASMISSDAFRMHPNEIDPRAVS